MFVEQSGVAQSEIEVSVFFDPATDVTIVDWKAGYRFFFLTQFQELGK